MKIAQSPFEINWHLGEWNNVGTILMGHPVFGVQKLLDKHFMVWIPLLKYKWVIGNSNPKMIILSIQLIVCRKKMSVIWKGCMELGSAVVLHISSFSTEIEEGDSLASFAYYCWTELNRTELNAGVLREHSRRMPQIKLSSVQVINAFANPVFRKVTPSPNGNREVVYKDHFELTVLVWKS